MYNTRPAAGFYYYTHEIHGAVGDAILFSGTRRGRRRTIGSPADSAIGSIGSGRSSQPPAQPGMRRSAQPHGRVRVDATRTTAPSSYAIISITPSACARSRRTFSARYSCRIVYIFNVTTSCLCINLNVIKLYVRFDPNAFIAETRVSRKCTFRCVSNMLSSRFRLPLYR